MKKLTQAVIEQLNCGDNEIIAIMNDVAHYGADSGFGGFTYYNETVKFYRKSRKLITEQIALDAEEFGTNLIEFIRSFRCIKEIGKVTDIEIVEVLAGNIETDAHYFIANCLSWYALEAVAYYVTEVNSNLLEEGE